MKFIKEKIFEGANIFSNKSIIKIDIDFEEEARIFTKDIINFTSNFLNIISKIKKHKDNLRDDMFLMNIKDLYIYFINELEFRLNLKNKFEVIKINEKNYYAIIEYEHKNTTLEIWTLALDLINSLTKNKEIRIETRLKEIENLKLKETVEPSVKAIVNKAIEKNMPVIKLDESNFYQIGYGKSARVFNGVVSEKTNASLFHLSCDKVLSNEVLKKHCMPVIDRKKINSPSKVLSLANEIGYPIVLKNQYESKDNLTINNIENEKSLLTQYKIVSKKYENLTLEKHIEGNAFRVCVIDYKVVGASLRIRPFITGDEKRNIKQLIQDLNNDKKRKETNNAFSKIKIDEELLSCIEYQGFNINSIPMKEEKIYLKQNANFLNGGISEDYTDALSEQNKEICEKVAKLLNLDICGIDIITEDISKSLNKTGVIIDVTASPDITIHEFPYIGKRRGISDAILNMVYQNYINNIPVISVLGKDNEDMIIKGVNYVLSRMGYVVGAKSKNTLIIDNEYIKKGEYEGSIDSKSIFLNKEVDISILSSTKEEVLLRGLDYGLCDIAIIKECEVLSKEQKINLIDELVLKSIKNDGYVIMNADEIIDFDKLNEIKVKKILFSMDGESEMLKYNREIGNAVVYVDNEILYVENNKKKYMICKLKDIPIIANYVSEEKVQNIMAICAGLVALKVDYCMIAKALKSFENKLNESI